MISAVAHARVVRALLALSPGKRLALLFWLGRMLVPAKSAWRFGTYALKHEFASHHRRDDGPSGFYTSNDEFAGACVWLGFELEEAPGTFRLFARPRSRRTTVRGRRFDRRYVGRISFQWWERTDVDLFAELAHDENGEAA